MESSRSQIARIAAKQSPTKKSLLLLIVLTTTVYSLLDSLETILDQCGCRHNPPGSSRDTQLASWRRQDIQDRNDTIGPGNRPQLAAAEEEEDDEAEEAKSAHHIRAGDNFENPSWCRYIHLGGIRIMLKPIGRAQAIRLLRFDAPKSIQVGQPMRLRCLYEVGRGDRLQSLAWYKNGREFYRYQPFERKQPVLAFNLSGVSVDMSKSKNSTVVLVNTTSESSGRYRCEATGTSFQEVNMETFINVITPANSRGIRASSSQPVQITALLLLYLCSIMFFV